MNNCKRLALIIISLLFISSCSSLSGLKFWGNEEETEQPTELISINQTVEIQTEWNKKLGIGKNYGRIVPAFSGDQVVYISANGELSLLDKETGNEIWKKETGEMVSGAIAVGFKRIFFGSLDGEIICLDLDDGTEIWRSQTTSEILSTPVTNGSVVVIQSADGKVTGFNFKDGKQMWVHQSAVPKLTLRGTATPILGKGFIFTGFANGKVAMIYPDSGAIRLEMPVTINEGKSELERVVDVDGKSVLSNNVLISASYQGNITAINLLEGKIDWQEKVSTTHDLVAVRSRVMAIDAKDSIKAFGVSTGAILWQQEGLRLREMSSPAIVGTYYAVGDFEGYVHILDSKDGSFLARKKISNKPILAIVSEGKNILVLDNAGKLTYLTIG